MGCILTIILSFAAIVTAFIHKGPYLLLLLIPIPACMLAVAWITFRRRVGKNILRWLRARMGWGRTIEELARRVGLDVQVLCSAQPTYTEVEIPKRNGGKRRLHVPDPSTKALQRAILHRVLGRLAAHSAAHAFERGRSIVTQAALHVGRATIIKIDMVDFFPATGVDRVEAYFRQIGWNREAAALLTRLTTTADGLPQGAPTSPRLANLVNFALDRNISTLVTRYRGTYSRYADDITISFPEDWPKKVRGIIIYVRRVCKRAGYKIHGKPKLGVYRPHQRQMVCGLVVNRRISLARERRRWLRAVAHRLKNKQDASLTPAQLDGWKAYQRMIELGEAKRAVQGRDSK